MINEHNFNEVLFQSIGKHFINDEAKEIAYILDLTFEEAHKEVNFNLTRKVDNQLFSIWLDKKSKLN